MLVYTITSLLADSAPQEVGNSTPQVVFDFSTTGIQVLSLLVGTVLPLLVGLVTKVSTSPGTKATLLAALSAASGLLTELLASAQANVSYDLAQGLLTAVATFIVAVGMHYGLWKPTGASAKAQQIGS